VRVKILMRSSSFKRFWHVQTTSLHKTKHKL
jgi:hypothetical protein